VSHIESELVKHIDEAYAMEQNVLRMLDGMISTTDDEQIVQELEHHKIVTESHADRMREALERHGASPSATRELVGILGAVAKMPLDLVRSEQAGRNARDAYATEHMEIAAYELLAIYAERAGDHETASVARAIVNDEREMAETIAASWSRFAELSMRDEGVRA
jgi:ferritin-like metal-binding protein YciE